MSRQHHVLKTETQFLPTFRYMTSDKIIDLNHYGALPLDFSKYGITFVFLKATQGRTYKDPTFLERVGICMQQGVPFGAYHFLDGSDPQAQAAFFMSVVGQATTILANDWEDLTPRQGGTATENNSTIFQDYIQQRTGKGQWVYGSDRIRESQAAQSVNPVFQASKLWLAYPQPGSGPLPQNFTMPESTFASWSKISLLQYSYDEPGYHRPLFYDTFQGADFNFGDTDDLK